MTNRCAEGREYNDPNDFMKTCCNPYQMWPNRVKRCEAAEETIESGIRPDNNLKPNWAQQSLNLTGQNNAVANDAKVDFNAVQGVMEDKASDLANQARGLKSTRTALQENLNKLPQNIEKGRILADKSKNLNTKSSEFNNLNKQLLEQMRNKKWYEI